MLSNIYELYQTDRIGIRVTDTYDGCVKNKTQDNEKRKSRDASVPDPYPSVVGGLRLRPVDEKQFFRSTCEGSV